MSLVQTLTETEYPETDGKPMGETDLHRQWTIRIFDLLSHRYRGQRVYVSCDLLLYYAEGNPHEFVVPDAFVVKDCDPRPRRVYKLWEENKAPEVVFEVTSKSTRREDLVYKPRSYAKIGVREYFLYDPTSDYLSPPLQGFRFAAGEHSPIEPDSAGDLSCRELGLILRLEDGQLVIVDQASGKLLLTEGESERAARLALEEEVRQLREELQRYRDERRREG